MSIMYPQYHYLSPLATMGCEKDRQSKGQYSQGLSSPVLLTSSLQHGGSGVKTRQLEPLCFATHAAEVCLGNWLSLSPKTSDHPWNISNDIPGSRMLLCPQNAE